MSCPDDRVVIFIRQNARRRAVDWANGTTIGPQTLISANVRFGPKADMCIAQVDVLQKGRNRFKILWIPARCGPLDFRFGRFFPPPDFGGRHGDIHSIAKATGFGRSCGTRRRGTADAAGREHRCLAGAGATAVDISPPFVGPDFPVCHTPAATGLPNMMLRLAQTEVPRAEMSAASSAPAFADTEPPLWAGLGSITYKITTANERAQAYFDQGLRLAYAFNHGEAQRAFRMAQKLDPDCAMCFWGEALVLGPNINLPMQEDAVAPAYAAAQKAKALAGKASPREQALIGALAARYGSDPKAARAPFDAAYAAEMAKVATQFSDDDEIATLYAEAVMDLSPWNYWKPGGREPNPQSVPIVPTLERVLARNPNHPGAIHFYIHAVEASDRPKRAEPYADRLRGAIPGAGHLVHMPSHIYYRVGRYLDALEDNKTAVKVDEKYLADTNAPMGVYRLGYYPHNVHFVMASAQMAGDGQTVIAAAEKLRELIPDEAAAWYCDGAAGQGGALFRARAVQHARDHFGAARSRRRDSLCQGDVALHARRRAGGAP